MNSEERYIVNSRYFFDTYALIEIYEGSQRYASYAEAVFFVTKLNLFEFHQYLLRKNIEKIADADVKMLMPHLSDFSMEIVKKASKFRRQNRNKNLSMADGIGYVYARENNLVFLTGDNGFQEMENIESISMEDKMEEFKDK